MLARAFLTAKELRCSQIELEAATEVLSMLERGELQQISAQAFAFRVWKDGDHIVRESKLGESQPLPSDAFNITFWSHCMGGWMERAKGRQLSQQCMQRWSDLFEPEGWDTREEYFTTERCARALHAKLTTGKAVWD
jgi:hypothetical protein